MHVASAPFLLLLGPDPNRVSSFGTARPKVGQGDEVSVGGFDVTVRGIRVNAHGGFLTVLWATFSLLIAPRYCLM